MIDRVKANILGTEMPKEEEMNRMKVETAIMKTMVKYGKKYGDKIVLDALRNVVKDVNKVLEEVNNRRG